MCIDFRQLNAASPKDCYPLPNINKLVQQATGNKLMSFQDAYSGYYQIPLAEEDQDKMLFYVNDKTWCYVRMPFGLKNAGATFCRVVNYMFAKVIGEILEVYIDDMLVKSKLAVDHVGHLEKVFTILRNFNMRLNPNKCTFGVRSGKFLGYLVSQRGIEANPYKIRAVVEMKSPSTAKELQSLSGRLITLNKFISRYSDKCAPFFKVLKTMTETTKYVWTPECEAAFQKIEYLNNLPLLVALRVGETLLLYIGVSEFSLSEVLI